MVLKKRYKKTMHRIYILAISFVLCGCAAAPKFEKVPSVTITFQTQTQKSKVGSFCWPLESGTMCSEPIAWPSPKEPLIVSSPFRLKIAMPIPEKVKHVEYMVSKVTESDMNKYEVGPDTTLWNVPVENVEPINSIGKQSLELQLEPGLYVLTLFAWWFGIGDATHGFLIEVKSY